MLGEKIDKVVDTCHKTLHRLFELQGLEMACFAAGNDLDKSFSRTVAEAVEFSVDANDPSPLETQKVVLSVLRGVFYDSTDEERGYLGRLSRTYTMLFALQADPKIAEYFDKMSRHLILYVGSDIIIRALSEYFLDEKDQSTANLLNILSAAGAKLILTEKTLKEVWTHMRSDYRWFEAEYQGVEHLFDVETARNFPRILMRSYMYVKFDPTRPSKDKHKSFADYLNTFVDISDLRSDSSADSLQAFLIAKFKMKFESSAVMTSGINQEELDSLTNKILAEKKGWTGHQEDKRRLLAENDAIQVLRIYKRRQDEGDNSPTNPFGYSIWWLTQEVSVVRATYDLVSRNSGARYLMRPEFLLIYVSYAPKLKEIRDNFRLFFPSKLGIRLSYRAKKDVFENTVKEAQVHAHTDEARARYTVRKLTNELKGGSYAEMDNEPVRE